MKTIVVAGATASGKTKLAVYLAQHLKGEIISADSRQVYRGMDLGTGKDLHEFATPQGTIPHYLIDIVPPTSIYTLYHYQQDCYKALETIAHNQATPILCGGTGLYIEAILKQYHIANVPEDSNFRKTMMLKEKKELQNLLKHENPILFTTTDLQSKKRIVRALEITAYGKDHTISYSDQSAIEVEPCVIVPLFERSHLLERIDQRLKERLDAGMVEEVAHLLEQKVPYERMQMLGLEYREISDYLIGKKEYNTMVDSLRTNIHRFSKRQMTWFRGMQRRGSTIHWVENGDTSKALEIAQHFMQY